MINSSKGIQPLHSFRLGSSRSCSYKTWIISMRITTPVVLPHGYRLPLMFVYKYRWECITSALKNGEAAWNKGGANMFHLSRL
ncbi:hypothetical protein BYT27DRAFT_6491420 [Phlegmacium glaucopus]|nr:hypothetical protein BYT27DRAFT_6491420 [Phlegmacium glaucopus]